MGVVLVAWWGEAWEENSRKQGHASKWLHLMPPKGPSKIDSFASLIGGLGFFFFHETKLEAGLASLNLLVPLFFFFFFFFWDSIAFEAL
jgi:hypothetical protein